MTRDLRVPRMLLWSVAASVLGACATSAIEPDVPKSVERLGIAPYQAHEECVKLVPGDRLEYRFAAGAPLAFNIHYHEGQTVVMPLSRENTKEETGVYTPTVAHHYCLMWEAGPQATTLDYRIRLRSASR